MPQEHERRIRMLKIVVVAMIVAFPAQSLAEELRIATLNCEFLNRRKVHIKFGEDFDFDEWDEATRNEKFLEATEAVAEEIARIDAHVVVLTEVGNAEEVQELFNRLDFDHHAVCNSRDSSTGQHVAILSKLELSNVRKRVPGRETYDVELDDPDEEKETGLSKAMSVSFVFEGETIHLYALHLKSERGFSESDGQRVAQASIVRRHYLPLLQSGEHVIVAGDLNDKRGDPTLRRIRGQDDIWGDLIQTGLSKFWDAPEERWTYQFRGDRTQIDHILPSHSLKKGNNISAEIHVPTTTIGSRLVTDHRGLIVKIGF